MGRTRDPRTDPVLAQTCYTPTSGQLCQPPRTRPSLTFDCTSQRRVGLPRVGKYILPDLGSMIPPLPGASRPARIFHLIICAEGACGCGRGRRADPWPGRSSRRGRFAGRAFSNPTGKSLLESFASVR